MQTTKLLHQGLNLRWYCFKFSVLAIDSVVSGIRFQGKVKSIYENMKNLMDPTPRFDSHISKNSSKVTSLNSYHAFELTQVPFKLQT